MTLKRTGTAGGVGLVAGLTGSAAPWVAGVSAVTGGLLTVTSPTTLPEIDEGLLNGGVAVSAYYLAGLTIWLGLVGLMGVGAVVVIQEVSRRGGIG